MRSEKLFTARSLEAWGGQVALVLSGVLTLVALLLLTGCASPAVRQQRFVAKPNMTFSDSAAFTYNSTRLLPQLAPGLSGSGASQNSGCTSCR